MPSSQLKRLKASLREQGITGPQKSKKQKKAQHGRNASERVQRSVALHQIRDSFNPFEVKANARPEKFASVSSRSMGANGVAGRYKEVLHRPGVSKSAGEEMRRNTLLPELQRRHKVGGLVDRRIGEGDVNMTPEERAVQRFAQEKERKRKGAGLFDLEASDDDEPSGFGGNLTHGGRSLDDLEPDDFQEGVSGGSDAEDDDDLLLRKRRRSGEEDEENSGNDDEETGDEPERKKTKKEVMEEVIAKSKFHKYERQKAKEDDDELREELDKGMDEMLSLLQGFKQPVLPEIKTDSPSVSANGPVMNPDRQKLLDGAGNLNREYDVRLRQLAQDTRAKPSERTKSVEEKAAAEAERLRVLEEKRMKRMRGEEVSEDEEQLEEDAVKGTKNGIEADDDDEAEDEAAEFGFASSTVPPKREKPLVLDDEDEFDLEEDLVASGSDIDISDSESNDYDNDDPEIDTYADEDDEESEFIRDVLGNDMLPPSTKSASTGKTSNEQSKIPYTYPCPRSHEELLAIATDIPAEQLIDVVKRIRALYHPSLSDANKDSMADFSCALVDHLSHMGSTKQPLSIIEQIIRHLHSLSRTYPTQIGETFRKHLASMHERAQFHAGDLVILTAIGSIYPTSDHWHQVVTPAITIIARWLSLNPPNPAKSIEPKILSTGGLLIALCIRYQTLSKRYIPEALRFTLRALSFKSADPEVLNPHFANLTALAELWKDHSAFQPAFTPALSILQRSGAKQRSAAQNLRILVQRAQHRRRPLELHHHRRRAIRTAIPKFEENFDPNKHYDPDKERSDAKKLQREYKRERKGAVRELRKDANFLAREQLRDKKARDAEYERKYRRLVAEVQAEEGYEKNEYEREKRARTKKRS